MTAGNTHSLDNTGLALQQCLQIVQREGAKWRLILLKGGSKQNGTVSLFCYTLALLLPNIVPTCCFRLEDWVFLLRFNNASD